MRTELRRRVHARVQALIAALALALPAAAGAAPVTDCPLRNAPFSAGSPLIDLLLSPAARGVLDRHLPGALAKFPPMFASTRAPSFAAILTAKELVGYGRGDPAVVARIDADLRKLPVTPADKLARCERYDNDDPKFAATPATTKDQPRLLIMEKMTGFRDAPGVNAAHAAFEAMAKRKHWATFTTTSGGTINPRNLGEFDVVIWNNVSGDILTLAQRRALKAFVERGGGFVAVHGSGGDPVYFWDWYADTLLGARFIGHPLAPQFQDARVVIDDPAHPVAQGLPASWTMKDEWYSFRTSPRVSGAHVIARLDEGTYSPIGMAGQQLRMGDHPIAWTRCVGRGRMAYSAIGHLPASYSEPHVVSLLENAVVWAAGNGQAACTSPK